MLIGYLGQEGSIICMAFLAKQVFRHLNYWSGKATETDTKETFIELKSLWNDAKQAKSLYRPEDNWEAFFKMFLLIPTQSEQPFRALLIKTINEISLWQQTTWLADKRIGGVGIKNKSLKLRNK